MEPSVPKASQSADLNSRSFAPCAPVAASRGPVVLGPSRDDAFTNPLPALGAEPKSLPDKPLDFLHWVGSFLGILGSPRIGLGSFTYLSLGPPACAGQQARNRASEIWPVPPPPRGRWTASAYETRPGPRRRRRLRKLALVRELVRLQVCTPNWLSLGCPTKPPPHAKAGAYAWTSAQHSALETLERLTAHFVSAEPLSASSLGRSAEKFDDLLGLATRLRTVEVEGPNGFNDLVGQLVSSLHESRGSYAGSGPRFPKGSSPNLGTPPNPACQHDHTISPSGISGNPRFGQSGPPLTSPVANSAKSHIGAPLKRATSPFEPKSDLVSPGEKLADLGNCRVDSGLACKPVLAERVKWTLPPSFDPVPFLSDPVVKATYIEPDTLRAAPDEWPKLPAARVHADRHELLALAAKWDSFEALQLIPVGLVDEHEACGCFCIPKDSEFDRLILNPTVINSRTKPYANFTKSLAPGCLLTLANIPDENHFMRFCADDLSEMYYTFKVSFSRAKRNSEVLPKCPQQ